MVGTTSSVRRLHGVVGMKHMTFGNSNEMLIKQGEWFYQEGDIVSIRPTLFLVGV